LSIITMDGLNEIYLPGFTCPSTEEKKQLNE